MPLFLSEIHFGNKLALRSQYDSCEPRHHSNIAKILTIVVIVGPFKIECTNLYRPNVEVSFGDIRLTNVLKEYIQPVDILQTAMSLSLSKLADQVTFDTLWTEDIYEPNIRIPFCADARAIRGSTMRVQVLIPVRSSTPHLPHW